MKFVILVPDGMADYPDSSLGDKTPLEVAETPNMDKIVKQGILGQVDTIPLGMTPASDVANMSIMGYDPKIYYSGRGPLEAANLGVELKENEVAFRCNLVTVNDDTMIDYSAGHISNKEADSLIGFLNNPKFDLRPILDLISREFVPLRNQIEWGYVIPYAISGMLNEHPRAAMALRNSENKENYREFYESLITTE